MTVGELVQAGVFCDVVEVVIRENGNGKWIQGYRVGSKVEQFPSECTVELKENLSNSGKIYHYNKHTIGRNSPRMTTGEIRDVIIGNKLPMKIIKKNVELMPEYIASLRVCTYQPRHIPVFHGDTMTHNEFSIDINCYPDGYIEPKKEQNANLDGQMNILDYLPNPN